MTYDLKPLKAPRSSGALLRTLTFLAESPLTGPLLARKFLSDIGIKALRETATDEGLPCSHQLPVPERGGGDEGPVDEIDLAGMLEAAVPARDGFQPETVAELASAYREGRSDPEAVAERVLEHCQKVDAMEPPLRVFIAQDRDDVMAQAKAAADRFRKGQPLSPLDGVPVAVKDELDMRPYPTTVGTAFLGQHPADEDAEIVARMRRAGAVLIGKANMTEIGLHVTGFNPHHGAARNPHDPTRGTGGSSSGSAAAVAAGLCPIALGADGGGSIRMPSALCGVVGLKATFGRISEHGAAPLCWSVAHVGPIAATVRDCALAYALIAGADPKDPNTSPQPPPHLAGLGEADLSGVRLGVFRPWFDDAEPDVVSSCGEMLKVLESAGAEVVEIDLPELALLRTSHIVTIVTEMITAHLALYARHRRRYALDTRLNLALGRRLRNSDYVQAQRHRARMKRHFEAALKQVDVIATPSTGCTAPPVHKHADTTGVSDIELTDRIIRFALPGNLVGLPAISFPAGYDRSGLPVGLQLMGRPWEEHLLLRIAEVGERSLNRRRPKVHFRLLEPDSPRPF